MVDWLKEHGQPDVVCLSNALLLGMCPAIKRGLGVKVVCPCKARIPFWMPSVNPTEPKRGTNFPGWPRWMHGLPSQYYGRTMQNQLKVVENRIHVVPNGIPLEGYQMSSLPAHPPVLGYCENCPRRSRYLVDAFAILKQDSTKHLKLIGGGCGPGDVAFVESLKVTLKHAGLVTMLPGIPISVVKRNWIFSRD